MPNRGPSFWENQDERNGVTVPATTPQEKMERKEKYRLKALSYRQKKKEVQQLKVQEALQRKEEERAKGEEKQRKKEAKNSRNNNTDTPSRPRPKTIQIDAGSNDCYKSRRDSNLSLHGGGRQADATEMAATAAASARPAVHSSNMTLHRSGSLMDSSDPRLYKQPAAHSNRLIILNAVEYCVFPGVVNREVKQRVLEEITKSESKNFLVLFRDSGLTFRALYSFNREKEEIHKIYGTGPKVVKNTMFEKFFKYNSAGKCFSEFHSKHLTVTIDAFTIHAGLWKKRSLPNKKDMTLVI